MRSPAASVIGALAVAAAALVVGAAAGVAPIYAVLLVAPLALAVVALTAGIETAGMICLVLGFGTAPMNQFQLAANATLADLLLLAGFLLLVPVMVSRRSLAASPPVSYIIGLAMVVSIGALASAGSSDPATSLFTLGYLLAALVGLPFCFAAWNPTRRKVILLAWSYVVGQMISFAASFALGHRASGRVFGLTRHPNFFGDDAMVACALAIFLWFNVPKQYRWLVAAATVVNGTGVFMSGSRADLLTCAILVLSIPVIERSTVAAATIVGLGAVGLIAANQILGSAGETSALGRLQGQGSATASDLQRTESLQSGMSLFWEHPVRGHGFVDIYFIHSIYLEVAVAIGAIGLIGYLMVLWSFIRRIGYPGRWHYLAYVPFGYAMLGLIDPALYDRGVWAAVALGFLVRPEADQSTDHPPPAVAAQAPRALTLRPVGLT